MQNKKLWAIPHTITKFNSKWIIHLNEISKTITLLGQNRMKSLQLWFRKRCFLATTTKAQLIKEKNDKLNFINIKTSAFRKILLREWKDKLYWKKNTQVTHLRKEFYPEYIKNGQNSIIKNKQSNNKCTKGLNKYFIKKDIEMANKYMKKKFIISH